MLNEQISAIESKINDTESTIAYLEEQLKLAKSNLSILKRAKATLESLQGKVDEQSNLSA